ncbi:MAG: sensor hybrid histidine kinase [Mycobacterium sp.]|nr:sensor hybrid histidine kinase [Mycobacterium sp.]
MRGNLFDWLGDAVLRFDRHGRLTAANSLALELLGESVGVGDTWESLLAVVAPGSIDQIRDAVPIAMGQSGFWRGQLKLNDALGHSEVFTALLAGDTPNGETEPDEQGRYDEQPPGYLLIFRSLAETRRRESSERELTARDEFVARLGHELRTPLNAVLGFAQLLELEELPRDQRDGIERILTAGRHMQALLDDVLDLARVRTGGVDLDVGPVRVLEVVRGVVDLIQPLADKRGIRRYVEPADDLVAMLDRRRLWQVLLNLIGNAVKYGREGGTVRVGVRKLGDDQLRIEVADDGPGMEPHQLDRLFRPFERLGAERTGVEGTGLGLALSRALTAAMGGTLSATSKLGSGSTFALDLEAAGSELLAELAGDDSKIASAVVLHVSADPDARALVSQALRSRLSTEVVSVQRAAVALAALHRSQPSLVIIDAELPDAVGTELLHRLNSDPFSALVPKIVLSTDTDPRVHLRLRAAGAHQVVQLPLDVRAFVETVGDLIRRPGLAEQ